MNDGKRSQTRKASGARVAGLALGIILVLVSVVTVAAGSMNQSVEEGRQLFQQYCQACHSIGGGVVVGPDLDGVVQRRDLDWLAKFIARPDELIASGDPVATELLAEYNNISMPNFGLSDIQVESILAYLTGAGEAGAEGAAGVDLSGGDGLRGQALFTGQRQFKNGGTACIACHNVGGAAPLGGGNLGPDLTHVYTRFGDPGFAGALVGLPFPTMQGIFSKHPLTGDEQADLYAFLIQADKQPAGGLTGSGWFWAAGVLGALLLFGIMIVFWPRQRKSISAQLRDSA